MINRIDRGIGGLKNGDKFYPPVTVENFNNPVDSIVALWISTVPFANTVNGIVDDVQSILSGFTIDFIETVPVFTTSINVENFGILAMDDQDPDTYYNFIIGIPNTAYKFKKLEWVITTAQEFTNNPDNDVDTFGVVIGNTEDVEFPLDIWPINNAKVVSPYGVSAGTSSLLVSSTFVDGYFGQGSDRLFSVDITNSDMSDNFIIISHKIPADAQPSNRSVFIRKFRITVETSDGSLQYIQGIY